MTTMLQMGLLLACLLAGGCAVTVPVLPALMLAQPEPSATIVLSTAE
jgi:hypothetical protein